MASILSPTQWGAQVDYDKWSDRYSQDDKIIVHYGGGSAYKTNDLASETRVLRIFEDVHLRKGWRGLAYGWAIGNTGQIYRGRGFNSYGAHQGDLDRDGISENSEGIPVVFILGTGEWPSLQALQSFHWLREEVLEPKAGRALPVYGHREVAELGTGTITSCPGNMMTYVTAERSTGIRIGSTIGDKMKSYAELVELHSAAELPDWSVDVVADYIAAGGTTVPKSMVRPAYRFDIAWFWANFLVPLAALVASLSSKLVALTNRVNALDTKVTNLVTADKAQATANSRLTLEISALSARIVELENRPAGSVTLAGTHEATITFFE